MVLYCLPFDELLVAGDGAYLSKARLKPCSVLYRERFAKAIKVNDRTLSSLFKIRLGRKQVVYEEGGRDYLLVDRSFEKKKCSECKAIALEGHTCITEGYHPVNIKYNDKKETYTEEFIYDMECELVDGVFYVYCIVVYNVTKNEYKEFDSSEEFVEYLFATFQFNQAHQKEGSLMIVVSYNGSRYDDIILHKDFHLHFVKRGGYEKDFFEADKGGALIFNSVRLRTYGKVHEIKFLDLTRYLPCAKSLRAAAIDLGVPVKKGFFPYQLIRRSITTCDYDEDGFIHPNYYDSPEAHLESKLLYRSRLECTPLDPVNLRLACLLYCKIDVEVTYECYKVIMGLYERINGHKGYNYHGAPSFCVAEAKRATGEKCYYAPVGRSYQLANDSLYGGWVGIHFVGVVDTPLSMVDIVSHYPCSLTGIMPIGPLREMTLEEKINFEREYTFYDLESLPLFIADVIMIPPKHINCEVSSIPQRSQVQMTTGKGQLLWSFTTQKQTLNSVDIYSAYLQGWTFKFCEGGRGEIADRKGPIFRDFITSLGVKKQEAKAGGNATLTMMYKIMLNSCIGAMGQRVEKRTFIRNPTVEDLAALNLGGDKSTDLRVDTLSHLSEEGALVISVNTLENKAPIQWASFMYAYSRYIRADLIRRCNYIPEVSVKDRDILFYYGDTDSIVAQKEGIDYARQYSPEIFGKQILGYNSTTHRFEYNIEVEDLYQKGEHVLGIFLSKKSYALLSTTESKVRLKGHKLINITCEDHKRVNCYCLCTFDEKLFSPKSPDKGPKGEPIYLGGVTLTMMYYVAIGKIDQFLIRYERFSKNLFAPTKDHESFTVTHIARDIIFRKPHTTLKTYTPAYTIPLGIALHPICDGDIPQ